MSSINKTGTQSSISGIGGAGGPNGSIISSFEGNTGLKEKTVGENVKRKELAFRSMLKGILPEKSGKEIENVAQKMLEKAGQKTLEGELEKILEKSEVEILKNKGILKKLGEVKTKKAQKESVNRYTNEETNGTDKKIFDTTISKNYIGQAKSGDIRKGGNVSNVFEGLSKEDIKELKTKGVDVNALSPEKVREKSVAFVNVLSNSLKSSLEKLVNSINNGGLKYNDIAYKNDKDEVIFIKSLVKDSNGESKTVYKNNKGEVITEEQVRNYNGELKEEKVLGLEGNKEAIENITKFAKLTGKLAQSFGRLVPGATMGALGNIEDENVKKEAEKIAFGLKKISDACGKLEGIVGKTEEEVLDCAEALKLPDNLDEMENFAKNSFGFNNIKLNAELLAARNLSSDMKIIQFDATIIDLMEDLDKEYGKYGVELKDYDASAEGLKKDVQDTFAKLGLLLKGESIDKLIKLNDGEELNDEDLKSGFTKARETREFMEKVRKSSMFSEFKYQKLNASLAKKLKEFGFKAEEKEILKKIEEKFRDKFGPKTGDIKYPRGGFRGRNENLFNFAYTEKNGPYTKEAYDKLVKDEQQKTFFSEAQELGALYHKYQTNITASENAVDDVLINILNNLDKPGGILSGEKMPDKKSVEDLRKAILDTDVGNGQKLEALVDCKDGVYESKKTFAHEMMKNDLRTICGPSGTTTDIVVGLVGIYGKEAMGKILEPFAKLVGEACKDVKPDNEEAIGKAVSELTNELKTNYKGFKRLFSSIASYMQCGQYHSAGEVLGGLYTASLNFIDDTERGPRTNIDSFKTNFGVLCKVLSNDTDAFAMAA